MSLLDVARCASFLGVWSHRMCEGRPLIVIVVGVGCCLLWCVLAALGCVLF
jgi:hypothetical protein